MKIRIVNWLIETGRYALAEKLFKDTYYIQRANKLIGRMQMDAKCPRAL